MLMKNLAGGQASGMPVMANLISLYLEAPESTYILNEKDNVRKMNQDGREEVFSEHEEQGRQ
jgi:hypothetical protein